MGDRGQTATAWRLWGSGSNYSRWEIGGKPQRSVYSTSFPSNYSRWEIGGKPQHDDVAFNFGLHYSRWEIGGKPQRRGVHVDVARIIADGRSGANRNGELSAPMEHPDYSRWEIGGKPQHIRQRKRHRNNYSRWEIGGKPQPGHVDLPGVSIIADGRSGANRNRLAQRDQVPGL